MSAELNGQPSLQTIVRVQAQEIARLNDNRMVLLAMIEELRAAAAAGDQELVELRAWVAGLGLEDREADAADEADTSA